MAYEAKNYEALLGTEGFSEQMLKNHFTLYQGYVANTNKVAEALSALLKDGKTSAPEYSELKRRFGWEFDGMRMHELYFSGMKKGGKAPDPQSRLGKKIAENFGSFENWEKDFRATGAMRGIGWVALAYDVTGNRLFNLWINEHDAGHLPMCAVFLVMDVFEHAYMLDYGLKRADYINSFFKAIDWGAVEQSAAWI